MIDKKRNLIKRSDTLTMTYPLSAPIIFLRKDRGFYGSLILGIIGLLVIQCQYNLSTDTLKLLKGS